MKLEGRVVLVTGGSNGIGAAIVRLFAMEGAHVMFCGRSEEAGRKFEADLSLEHLDAAFRRCDVTDEDAVGHLASEVVELYGRLDILVNNAGIGMGGHVEDMSLEDWRRVVEVNLTGAFLVTKTCIPHLRATSGVVINLGSTFGLVGAPGYAAYAASKAALISLSKSLALELAPDHIRVNALCPGATVTNLFEESMRSSPDQAEARRAFEAGYPIGRLSEPIEQARAALFLAADDSSFMTGQTLVIDGGYTAR